jgi:DNA-binding MarR family transcriptional regulator
VSAHDHVDWATGRWARERPDLDTAAKAVTQRIGRAARHIERAVDQVFEPFGLDPHEFYVLGVLRRAGSPFRLTPTALARTLLLTPGSVTYRINRLEQASLVTRIPDPADRRGVFVELTPRGLELADRAIEALAEAEARIVEPLEPRERRELARLLRKLLLSFGDEPPR